MPSKNPIGKLRATIVLEWEVTELEHYNAKSLEEAAKLTQDQLNTGDLGLYDLNEFGNQVSATVEAVPTNKEPHARARETKDLRRPTTKTL